MPADQVVTLLEHWYRPSRPPFECERFHQIVSLDWNEVGVGWQGPFAHHLDHPQSITFTDVWLAAPSVRHQPLVTHTLTRTALIGGKQRQQQLLIEDSCGQACLERALVRVCVWGEVDTEVGQRDRPQWRNRCALIISVCVFGLMALVCFAVVALVERACWWRKLITTACQ